MYNAVWIKEAVNAYLACALQADGEELGDDYTIHNATAATRTQAEEDFKALINSAVLARIDLEDYDAEQVGHDLWLTRCGHGTGFWDRPEVYGKKEAEKLGALAGAMGTRYPYAVGRKWGISF